MCDTPANSGSKTTRVHLSVPTARRARWIASAVGRLRRNSVRNPIGQRMGIFYIENCSLMARGRRRPEEGFRPVGAMPPPVSRQVLARFAAVA